MGTREKILASAKKLFAKNGFEEVSIRDVTQHAKVNLASVNYHFGNKLGLIEEVIIEVLIPMNKQRVRLLKQAGEAAGGLGKVQIKDMIEAWLRPVVCPEEHGGQPDIIAQLIARYIINVDHDVPQKVMDSFGDLYKIYSIAIQSQCPEMHPKKALERLIFSTGAIFNYRSFAGLASQAMGSDFSQDIDYYLRSAVSFCEAGFRAE